MFRPASVLTVGPLLIPNGASSEADCLGDPGALAPSSRASKSFTSVAAQILVNEKKTTTDTITH